MKKAQQDEMKAVAITDHGNMFGAFKFYSVAKQHGITPIIGCEFYVVEDRFNKDFSRERKDKRHHQLLLAKDAQGYKNLSKLCSLGFIEGAYGNFPRIDKELLRKYKDGLVATTCCVAAEVPRTFLEKGEAAAEKVFLEWLEMFGEDYYIELQRHGIPEQEKVNAVLLKFAAKYNVKIIASNDSPDNPFGQSLNPYRGCSHACAGCFARVTHTFLDMNGGDGFSQVAFVPQESKLIDDTIERFGLTIAPDKRRLDMLDGFIGEGQMSYAGTGAVARGRLALQIVLNGINIVLSIVLVGSFGLGPAGVGWASFVAEAAQDDKRGGIERGPRVGAEMVAAEREVPGNTPATTCAGT